MKWLEIILLFILRSNWGFKIGLLLGVIITVAVIAKTNNDFGNWLSNDVYSFLKGNVNHLLKR